jgi:hypothetical protein
MGNGVGKPFDGCRCDQVSAAQGSLESFDTVRNCQVLNPNLADWRCAQTCDKASDDMARPPGNIEQGCAPPAPAVRGPSSGCPP